MVFVLFEFPQIAVNNSNSSEIVVGFSSNIAFYGELLLLSILIAPSGMVGLLG